MSSCAPESVEPKRAQTIVDSENLSADPGAVRRANFPTHDPTRPPPISPPSPIRPPLPVFMSAAASRAVLRQSRFAVRRAGVRNASSTAEAAKEKAAELQSKASEGLSRVTSSASAAASKVGSAVSETAGKVGGRTGRVIGGVQGQYTVRVGGISGGQLESGVSSRLGGSFGWVPRAQWLDEDVA